MFLKKHNEYQLVIYGEGPYRETLENRIKELNIENNAKFIAEGGRRDQEFVIELPGMAQKRFPELVGKAGLKLLLPVYDITDNWKRDNELATYGFISKTMEPKCLIGCPVNNSIDQDVIDGVHLFYDNFILDIIDKQELLSTKYQKAFNKNSYNEMVKPLIFDCDKNCNQCSIGIGNAYRQKE